VNVTLTRMHGSENRFFVLDARTGPVPDVVDLAKHVCANGAADGLLVIVPSLDAYARMRVINADGSEPEMCGNGVRCVARFLAEADGIDSIVLETLAGPIAAVVESRDPFIVRVGMGPVHVERQSVAMIVAVPIPYRYVDVGNPHAVMFVDDVDAVDLDALGSAFQRLPAFPNGTNVHVASVVNASTLRVRHWERGVGQTQACGTGAVACAFAAWEAGRIVGKPATILVPGGTLGVAVADDGTAELIGPAVREETVAVALA
jgi:diaminopimelate epimerase